MVPLFIAFKNMQGIFPSHIRPYAVINKVYPNRDADE